MLLSHYNASEKVDSVTGCTCTYIDGQNWNPHLHDHDFFEIFLTLDDGIVHYINGEYQPLPKNTLAFVRPSDVHTFVFKKDEKNDMITLAFNEKTIRDLFTYLTAAFPSEKLLESENPPLKIITSQEASLLAKKALSILRDTDGKDKSVYIRLLLAEMLTTYFGDLSKSKGASMPKWLEELCMKMQRPENFILGAERLHELSKKDRAYLGRAMRKHLNTTPSAYINSLRLGYAATLITSSSDSITDICFASGFNSMSQFYALFREKYNMSPLELRQKFSGKSRAQST